MCFGMFGETCSTRRRERHGGRVERGWGVCKDRFAVSKEDKRGRVGGRGGLSSKGRELDCVILDIYQHVTTHVLSIT